MLDPDSCKAGRSPSPPVAFSAVVLLAFGLELDRAASHAATLSSSGASPPLRTVRPVAELSDGLHLDRRSRSTPAVVSIQTERAEAHAAVVRIESEVGWSRRGPASSPASSADAGRSAAAPQRAAARASSSVDRRLHHHEQPRGRRRRRDPGDAARTGASSTRELVGRDPTTDVAVIKIDGRGPPRPSASATERRRALANGCWRSAIRSATSTSR